MNKQESTISADNIALQSWLRPALTKVGPNIDYHQMVDELERISTLLRKSCLEQRVKDFVVEKLSSQSGKGPVSIKALQSAMEFAIFALRAEVLRHLRQMPSFREYSKMLASSDLLADFCGILTLDGIKWSSKSSLERASNYFTQKQWQQLIGTLTESAGNADTHADLGLDKAIDTSISLMDSTCLEANIHFPVDWVLLRDVAQTLLKAIKLVRNRHLLNRMQDSPEALAGEMNRLCIAMTHSARKKDGRKQRKRTFREMKALLKRIGEHAQKHHDLLESQWSQTDLSQREAQGILERMKDRIDLIPKVIHQAHERIIGGRKIASQDKILSSHEPDLHLLVRRKAGKEVEFGNALFIAESSEGYILDHHLYKEAPPGEVQKMVESLERQQALDLDKPITDVVGDRGFDSARGTETLKEQAITNHICPRNPDILQERLEDKDFRLMQKRRGGTEARIAIIKNQGGGRVFRAKGFTNRSRAVSCGILSHNLLWLAKRSLADMAKMAEAA